MSTATEHANRMIAHTFRLHFVEDYGGDLVLEMILSYGGQTIRRTLDMGKPVPSDAEIDDAVKTALENIAQLVDAKADEAVR